jgi:hypothetical protein
MIVIELIENPAQELRKTRYVNNPAPRGYAPPNMDSFDAVGSSMRKIRNPKLISAVAMPTPVSISCKPNNRVFP